MKTLLSKQIMSFQTDSFGIVHHARYLEILEEARWRYCRENGLLEPFHQRGIYHVIVNINIDYHSSARIGDGVVIMTELHQVTHSSAVFRQQLIKTNVVLVQADISNVYVNKTDHNTIPCAEMTDFWDDLNRMQTTR